MALTDEQQRVLAIARARARMAQSEQPRQEDREEAQAEPEMSYLDKARGVIQSVQRGQLLGFGDEIVGAGRAAVDYLLEPEGQSFSDRYKMYRDDERRNVEQFADENQKTALALNLVGGLASPVNYVAPQYGIGKNAGQALLRAGAEGAVAGAGEAESLEDVPDAMKSGAAAGAATNTAFRMLGKALGSTVLKRRVAETLDQGDGTFKPYHLAAPNTWIGKIYQQGVGRIPGAKQRLAAMEEPFITQAQQRAEDVTEKWTGRLQSARNARQSAVDQASDALSDAKYDINVRGSGVLEKAKMLAARKADDITREFQEVAAYSALPSRARDILDEVDINNSNETAKAIAKWWKNNGFDVVKNKNFPWKEYAPPELRKAIKDEIKKDPDLAIHLGNVLESVGGLTQRLKKQGAKEGLATVAQLEDMLDGKIVGINGDALMAIRNVFAMGANVGGKGARAQTSRGMRMVANKIDDFIRANLGDKELVRAFDQDIDRYTTALTYVQANRASGSATSFTPKQWETAAKRFTGSGMSVKDMPLGNQVRSASDAIESTNKLTKIKAAQTKTATQRMKREALQKAREAKRAAREAEDSVRQARLEAAKSGDIRQSLDELAELKGNVIPSNESILSDMLTATYMGNLVPAIPRDRGSQTAAGLILGNVATNKNVQNALAGQTGWQQRRMAELLRGGWSVPNRILSRQAAMEVNE